MHSQAKRISEEVKKEQLQKLGEMLKKRRKELNLSLQEAENATSIRVRYLQAIEEGNIKNILPHVYARGFFSQYACFLGEDGEKITRDNQTLFQISSTQHCPLEIGQMEIKNTPINEIKWSANIFWLILFILILISAWYFAKFLNLI